MRIVRTTLFFALSLALAACSRDDAPPAAAAAEAPATGAPVVAADAPVADDAPVVDPAGAAGGSWPAASAAAMLMSASEPGIDGTLTFDVADGGVRVTGTLTGFAPGATHALHVHENGRCDPPTFDSAGAHFNPDGSAHGDRSAGGAHHAGDIPNQTADADGRVVVDQVLTGLTIADGGSHDIVGKAVIVHAGRDDYATQPTGNAGGRIACGLVSLMTSPPPAGVGPADEAPPVDEAPLEAVDAAGGL